MLLLLKLGSQSAISFLVFTLRVALQEGAFTLIVSADEQKELSECINDCTEEAGWFNSG